MYAEPAAVENKAKNERRVALLYIEQTCFQFSEWNVKW